MALSPRSDAELSRKSGELMKKATDPVEKLRLACLARGAGGIRGLGRSVQLVILVLFCYKIVTL